MADPLTTTLRLTEPTIGGDSGLWAGYLNNNMIFTDQGVNQTLSISVPDSNVTLTADGTTSDQARYYGYKFTGALTANRTVTIPDVQRQGWAQNNTTGGFNIILKSGAGTTISLTPDSVQRLYATDGSTNTTLQSVGFGNVWHRLSQATVSSAANQPLAMPTAFQRFRVICQGITVGTNAASMVLQVSSDGGVTYLSGTHYQYAGFFSDSSGVTSTTGSGTAGFFTFSSGLTNGSAQAFDATIEIWPGSGSLRPTFRSSSFGFSSSSVFTQAIFGGGIDSAAAMNYVRVGVSTGTYSGIVMIEGMA